ncbi:MAG: hypothetical protein IJN97_05445 [Oscillospiraceae bacterium]|nr:hypothetical protein [Oscillospiraceae bacterium]MBQ7054645.1 hypothetical protein [Oscillospiraceae bacterium]
MKKYEMPKIEVIKLQNTDVIQTSGTIAVSDNPTAEIGDLTNAKVKLYK